MDGIAIAIGMETFEQATLALLLAMGDGELKLLVGFLFVDVIERIGGFRRSLVHDDDDAAIGFVFVASPQFGKLQFGCQTFEHDWVTGHGALVLQQGGVARQRIHHRNDVIDVGRTGSGDPVLLVVIA